MTGAPELTVTGRFRQPAMGQVVVPIPVTGEGSLSATAEGLRVRGTRGITRVGLALAVRAVVVMCLAFWALTMWSNDDGRGVPDAPFWLGVALFGVSAILMLDGRRLWRRAKAVQALSSSVELLVPWKCIKGIRRNEVPYRHGPPDTETIIIIIRGFDPSGGLYFVPHGRERMAQLETYMRAQNVNV